MKQRPGLVFGAGGLSLVVTILAAACSGETNGDTPSFLTLGPATPPPVAVAPTIRPDLTPITFRPGPDFAPITPPPVRPDLPDPPAGGLSLTLLAVNFATVRLTGLQVPGVIASVEIQFFNLSRGTDITGIFLPTAIDQFRNTLIGRGNTYSDRGGFGITFTFPASPPAYAANVASGETVGVIVVIRDAFGQALRLEGSDDAP